MAKPGSKHLNGMFGPMTLLQPECHNPARQPIQLELNPASVTRFDDAVHRHAPLGVSDTERAAVERLEQVLRADDGATGGAARRCQHDGSGRQETGHPASFRSLESCRAAAAKVENRGTKRPKGIDCSVVERKSASRGTTETARLPRRRPENGWKERKVLTFERSQRGGSDG